MRKPGKKLRSSEASWFSIGLAAIWLTAFFGFAFTYSSDLPPERLSYILLVLSGYSIAVVSDRARLQALLRRHPWLWSAWALFGVLIIASEVLGVLRLRQVDPWLTYQAWICFCMPVLAFFLAQPRWLRALTWVFAALCAWHLIMMPIEAITGLKLSWQSTTLIPRSSGILSYQASGLSGARYYYSGFYFPLFYLAVGLLQSKVVTGVKLSPRSWMLLPLLWLVPSFCTQSRSTFAGAIGATLVMLMASSKIRKAAYWLGPAVFAAGILIYWVFLTGHDKVGGSVHLAYFKHYIRSAMEWPYILVGHSQHFDRRPMFLWDIGLHLHSHNDFIEIFWKWGLPTLLAYLTAWGLFLRLIWTKFVRVHEMWPLAAVVALFPNMMTDLGVMHFEKVNFIVLLVAACVALNWVRSEKPPTSSSKTYTRR